MRNRTDEFDNRLQTWSDEDIAKVIAFVDMIKSKENGASGLLTQMPYAIK